MNFSDVLLTVDFDRTLTGPDSKIPQRNLDAIAWFTEKGGSFTVNTGRSLSTFGKYLSVVPANVPILLYNGSAAYRNGEFIRYSPIDLDMWETVMAVARTFPEMNVEIQGLHAHYLVEEKPSFAALYRSQNWDYLSAVPGADIGPFIKFAVYGEVHRASLGDMYVQTEEEAHRFRELERFIMEHWGDKVDLCYPAPRIIDVQAKGVSKYAAARQLQQEMGKKILVCVGDAENDIPMLDGADYAYCPADGVVADRYENVCNCAEGAVADVIYEKIPGILNIQP